MSYRSGCPLISWEALLSLASQFPGILEPIVASSMCFFLPELTRLLQLRWLSFSFTLAFTGRCLGDHDLTDNVLAGRCGGPLVTMPLPCFSPLTFLLWVIVTPSCDVFPK